MAGYNFKSFQFIMLVCVEILICILVFIYSILNGKSHIGTFIDMSLSNRTVLSELLENITYPADSMLIID